VESNRSRVYPWLVRVASTVPATRLGGSSCVWHSVRAPVQNPAYRDSDGAAAVAAADNPEDTKTPLRRGFHLERMMGLEPTTFCMANASGVRARARPFAQTGSLQRLPSG
jgi:hypothetical protein